MSTKIYCDLCGAHPDKTVITLITVYNSIQRQTFDFCAHCYDTKVVPAINELYRKANDNSGCVSPQQPELPIQTVDDGSKGIPKQD